jgi:hypothetical protein
MRVVDNPVFTAVTIVDQYSRQRLTRPAGDPAVEMATFAASDLAAPSVAMAGRGGGTQLPTVLRWMPSSRANRRRDQLRA